MAGRKQHTALARIPLRRPLVEPVPRELLEHEQRREACELVERGAQVGDVVERPNGDCGIEPQVVVQLLERGREEDRPFRGVGIDREHVVAAAGERPRQLAATAPDLDHARRHLRQLR